VHKQTAISSPEFIAGFMRQKEDAETSLA